MWTHLAPLGRFWSRSQSRPDSEGSDPKWKREIHYDFRGNSQHSLCVQRTWQPIFFSFRACEPTSLSLGELVAVIMIVAFVSTEQSLLCESAHEHTHAQPTEHAQSEKRVRTVSVCGSLHTSGPVSQRFILEQQRQQHQQRRQQRAAKQNTWENIKTNLCWHKYSRKKRPKFFFHHLGVCVASAARCFFAACCVYGFSALFVVRNNWDIYNNFFRKYSTTFRRERLQIKSIFSHTSTVSPITNHTVRPTGDSSIRMNWYHFIFIKIFSFSICKTYKLCSLCDIVLQMLIELLSSFCFALIFCWPYISAAFVDVNVLFWFRVDRCRYENRVRQI